MQHEEPTDEGPRYAERGDALGAMYVIAALAMAIGALVVIVVMFLPVGLFEDAEREYVWVPGSQPAWDGTSPGQALMESPGIEEIAPGRYEVVLVAYNWSFRPDEIRVPAGAEVTFRARSDEDYHGFAIAGTPILLSLKQSEVQAVTYTFREPGEYMIVCSEYCGAGHPTMTAKVIVEGSNAPITAR